jgi:hypothetical protein
MNIHELESFNLADAVKFNNKLNPRLWDNKEQMRPDVKNRLLEIAADFKEFLGVNDFELKDITVSGSNAAYSYTPHSDIDLHLVVDLPEADRSEIYRELFDAKKYQYNDMHNIKIGGYDVELYVQNANDPVVSQGEYSLLQDKWINVPKRVKANIDDRSTRSKYEDLQHRIEQAVKAGDYNNISQLLKKIKEMRKTGLDKHGEFGPENIAFKMLRSQGQIEKLINARNSARDRQLSLDEQPKKKVNYGFKTSLRESQQGDIEKVIHDFVANCVEYLNIQNPPIMNIKHSPEWSRQHGTFGEFDLSTHTLTINTHGRHMLDILRTLAHELTHCRQSEVMELPADAGQTGSPYEDTANAMAGRIMRNWAETHSEQFGTQELDEGRINQVLAAAAAAAALSLQPARAVPQAPDQQPAQVQQSTAGTVLDLARVIYNAKNITRAGTQEELTQELKNIIRAQGGDPGAANQSRVLQILKQRQQQNESASGYIPTKKQAKDPRYSMALTADIKPGQIGKEANKLKLDTDTQGHPALLIKNLANQLREFKETGRFAKEGQDQYGNFDPPGPETPPQMPDGTIKVDVSDMYDWYKIGQKISNLKSINKSTIGKGPPSTVLAFGSEELENMYSHDLNQLGLPTHDLDKPGEEDLDESILVTDVPNEDWLAGKLEYAKSRGRDSFGVPYMGSTTAYVRQPSYVELPVDLLARIPGARGEQSNVRYDDLAAIMKIMKDTGKLPLDRRGEEYMPFVTVAWDGSPWVSEGNHRIMAAKKLGWKTLPVELKYFDGGERIRSGVLYPGKIGLGEVENSRETDENPLVVVYDKDGELHTHANLSVANNIFRTHVKPDEVFKGPVKVKSGGSYGEVTFALSKHHNSGPSKSVTEAFDQPYKLKWYPGDWDEVTAYAEIPDGDDLSIMFNLDANEEGEEAWSVEFYRNDSQEVTGKGDEFRIFATVLSAIQTFIKKYKPNRVVFSASKQVAPGQKAQSRANLYDSLVQRYARALGFKAFRADAGNKVHYELNRINKGVAEGLRDVTIHSEFTEVFNTQPSKSATWARPIGKWDDMDEFNFVASNGIAYQVDFLAPSVGPDELDPYTFFEPDEEISDQAYESSKFVSFEQKSKPGDVGKQGTEGTGAAAEVFGIVTNVILQYIKKAKPSMLYFQAAETNRQRLYARMATRIAQTIGWKVKRDGPAHFAIYNPRKIKDKLPNQGVAEGVMSDLDQDRQDANWDAIVGYVVNGLKKNQDIGRMELALYKWGGKELVDVDQELEDRGFGDLADLAKHIQQHGGQYQPPTDFGLGNLGQGVTEANGMDQEQGIEWERELMRSWAPKAAAYMAKVVKNSFDRLYPNVPIRIRREDIMIMATTDPETRFSELDPDVFGQRDNPNWECSFVVTPLFYMEDSTRYLELMVDSASSGQYKGVWKLIAREWARYANSQLRSTGAQAVCFSVDQDHSDAWATIASQAGVKFIVHNTNEGVSENFADGKVKGKSRPGRVKRAGASCIGSVTDLRAKAKKSGGERGKMYHWCANMKSGKKKNESIDPVSGRGAVPAKQNYALPKPNPSKKVTPVLPAVKIDIRQRNPEQK